MTSGSSRSSNFTMGSARNNAKERAKKKKGIEGQRTKPLTPTLAIDALIGEEEQNGKQKKGTMAN